MARYSWPRDRELQVLHASHLNPTASVHVYGLLGVYTVLIDESCSAVR